MVAAAEGALQHAAAVHGTQGGEFWLCMGGTACPCPHITSGCKRSHSPNPRPSPCFALAADDANEEAVQERWHFCADMGCGATSSPRAQRLLPCSTASTIA